MPRDAKWILITAAMIGLPLAVPMIMLLIALAAIPVECDEGMVDDWRAANARGDIVAAYIKACTGIGTVVDESVVLQLHDKKTFTTLVEHGELVYSYPKFRWIDDDDLSVDLGKTQWVQTKTDRFGTIKISYAYATSSWGELW